MEGRMDTSAETPQEQEAAAGGGGLPAVLVTNDDGIEAPGLRALVQALVQGGRCRVFVCAPDSEKSAVAHGVTTRSTIEVESVSIAGVSKAFQVSGTPADCVSLSLSAGSANLFPWEKPTLVVSGINKGSNCGYHIIYSGTVAGAREAFMSGVPAMAVSLDWRRGESKDEEFKAAAHVSLPLIHAALRDIEKGVFPRHCFFNVDVPLNPSQHKGYKATKQGSSRLPLHWKLVPSHRRTPLVGRDTAMGMQMAQLGLAASAAGAARRANLRKNTEIESVGAGGGGTTTTSGNSDNPQKLLFRMETTEQEIGERFADLDFGALEDGYVTITALGLTTHLEMQTRTQAEEWVAAVAEFAAAAAPSAL
jgi:5'-nucleotidase